MRKDANAIVNLNLGNTNPNIRFRKFSLVDNLKSKDVAEVPNNRRSTLKSNKSGNKQRRGTKEKDSISPMLKRQNNMFTRKSVLLTGGNDASSPLLKHRSTFFADTSSSMY